MQFKRKFCSHILHFYPGFSVNNDLMTPFRVYTLKSYAKIFKYCLMGL